MVTFRIHRDDKWFIFRSKKNQNNQNQAFYGSENIPVVKVIKKTGDFIRNEIPFFMGWHVDAHPIQIEVVTTTVVHTIPNRIYVWYTFSNIEHLQSKINQSVLKYTVLPMYRSYMGLDHKQRFFVFSKARPMFVSVSFHSRPGDIRAVERFSRCHWIQNFNRWITRGGRWMVGKRVVMEPIGFCHVSNP